MSGLIKESWVLVCASAHFVAYVVLAGNIQPTNLCYADATTPKKPERTPPE